MMKTSIVFCTKLYFVYKYHGIKEYEYCTTVIQIWFKWKCDILETIDKLDVTQILSITNQTIKWCLKNWILYLTSSLLLISMLFYVVSTLKNKCRINCGVSQKWNTLPWSLGREYLHLPRSLPRVNFKLASFAAKQCFPNFLNL